MTMQTVFRHLTNKKKSVTIYKIGWCVLCEVRLKDVPIKNTENRERICIRCWARKCI